MGAAGAQTHKSLGHHLLHPLILRLLVLCGASADFEAQSSLLKNGLHPQIHIPNACPADPHDSAVLVYLSVFFMYVSMQPFI